MSSLKQKLWQGVLIGLISMILSIIMFAPAKAADYNCGTYGAGNYQSAVCGATSNSGGLGNTGQPFWQYLIAASLILAGVYLLLRSRKNMKSRSKQSGKKPTDSE